MTNIFISKLVEHVSYAITIIDDNATKIEKLNLKEFLKVNAYILHQENKYQTCKATARRTRQSDVAHLCVVFENNGTVCFFSERYAVFDYVLGPNIIPTMVGP